MILNKNILEKYDTFMQTSKVYDCLPIIYPILGLNGEAGEAAEKVKKCLRDNKGKFDEETKNAIKKELADVLWYIWAAADDMNTGLDEIMSIGMQKVKERQETNTVHGSGDNRESQNFFEKYLKTNYNLNKNQEKIEESDEVNNKRVLSIYTDSFENIKELQYKMKHLIRNKKIELTIVEHINANKEIHTYKGIFHGVGRIDGSILVQLENENDVDKILEITNEPDMSNHYDLMINKIIVYNPRVREIIKITPA